MDIDKELQEHITTMQEYCLEENRTLWVQGDALVKWAHPDDQLQVMAERCRRTLATLKERENVARQFPESERDYRHAWTVYKILAGIPDGSERKRLLASRYEWTVDAMQVAVRTYHKAQAEKEGRVFRGISATNQKSGMRLENISIKGELSDGTLQITIDYPVQDVHVHDLGKKIIIQCEVPSPVPA